MITIALALLLQQTPAAEAPASAPATSEATTNAASEADFAAALAADQKAAEAAAPPPAPVAPSVSGALMNPETSVILTSSAGLARRDVAPVLVSGEDAPIDTAALQEVELTFAADVDPYFKARLFLALPHLESVEVEEGYLITTSLPWNLQLKAGVFRSAFGRNNEQHLHVQDFARRPLTTALLGHHGLTARGAQLSVLLPLPFFTMLWAEVFALTPRKASTAFGLDTFFELSPSWSLMLGASGASVAAGLEEEEGHVDPEPAATMLPPRRTLVGGDLYLKWLPINTTQSYAWVAFTAEYIAARADSAAGTGPAWTGAAYAQLIAQVARRWRVGVRGDVLGLPRPAAESRGMLGSASVAFLPTEFSRLRFTYQRQSVKNAGVNSDLDNDLFFVQLEGTIGAHGAHPF